MSRKRTTPHVAGSTNTSVELLLAEPVAELGIPGDIVKVKPGYARNFLIPQGLATMATEENRRSVEKHRARLLELQASEIKKLQELAEQVGNYSTTIEANANADGQLYGSVTEIEISKALKEANLPIEPDQIKLTGVLKEIGMYTIAVQFHENVTAEVKVWVVPSADEMPED
ncbi:MAG: 50S ribosomal protein L9 [Planctomycetaceae bacterium]|nr:50S ribosomal protein L9 [Planctomycetaceae bacterium]